jgi:phage/plasmid-like protein (TIGR03299 family)
MAHEISMVNGQANFAFVGSRSEIWHGLGQELAAGASIEEWKRSAGFEWSALETPVMFNGLNGIQASDEKKVLYRSDTGTELAVVGSNYKVVQPGQVLEFFRDLVEGTGIVLDTAGQLFGGRRFFASANTKKAQYIGNKDDIVLGNLLLATSVDGTLATNAGFFSTRVVCNNTLRMALHGEEKKGTRVRVTHRQIFNPEAIKRDLGLIDSSWESFIENMNKLASKQVSDTDAKAFVADLVLVTGKDNKPTPQSVTIMDKIMNNYSNGRGADMTKGNLWGVLNAVTEYADHQNRVRTPDQKAWDKFYGKINDLKNEAAEKLLELV